jgi:hypothetical protein
MRRATSGIRTLTRRLSLSLATTAGHTVRIANRAAPVLPSLAGFGLVSWGAAMIYTPAGWITGGVSLLILGWDLNRTPVAPKPTSGGE